MIGDQRAWDATISDSREVGWRRSRRLGSATPRRSNVGCALKRRDGEIRSGGDRARRLAGESQCAARDQIGLADRLPAGHRRDPRGADTRPTASGRRGRRDLTRRIPNRRTRTPGSSGRSPSGRTSAGSTSFGSRSSRKRNDRSTQDVRVAGAGVEAGEVRGRDRDVVPGRRAALDVDRDVADPGLAVRARRQAMSSSVIGPPPRWQRGHQYVVRGTSPASAADRIERAASRARPPGASVDRASGARPGATPGARRRGAGGPSRSAGRASRRRGARPARTGRRARRTASRSARCCRSRRAPAGRAAPRRSASAARPGSRSRRSASAASAAPARRARAGPARAADSAGWSASARVSNSSTHRRVEADRDRARDLEHEPRPGRRPAPALAGPVAVPRAVHPQVGPQLEAVVEADQQVLAVRLDRVDRRARRARSTCGTGPGPAARGRSPSGRRGTAGGRPRSGRACRPRACGSASPSATGAERQAAIARRRSPPRAGVAQRRLGDRHARRPCVMTSSRTRPSATRRARPRSARSGDLRVVGGRQRLERRAAALEVQRGHAVDERRRTRRPRAGTAAGRRRRDAATGARRRTGWPGRRRPAGGPRARPASRPARGPARSRSSAPASANWAAPSPSTK